MKYILHRDFIKSLAKIPARDRLVVENFIYLQIAELKSISEIRNIVKLSGYVNAYRVRFGDYRLGFF